MSFLAGVRAGQPERPRRPPPAASPAPSAPEDWLPKSLPLPALRLTSSGSRCSGDRAQQPVPTERTTLLGTHHHPCPLSRPLGISSSLRARTVSATPGAEGEAGRCPECPLPPDRLDLRKGLAPQVSSSPPPKTFSQVSISPCLARTIPRTSHLAPPRATLHTRHQDCRPDHINTPVDLP